MSTIRFGIYEGEKLLASYDEEKEAVKTAKKFSSDVVVKVYCSEKWSKEPEQVWPAESQLKFLF